MPFFWSISIKVGAVSTGIYVAIREFSDYFKGDTTVIDTAQGLDLDSNAKWFEVSQAAVQVNRFAPMSVGAGEETGSDKPSLMPFYIGKEPDLTTGLFLENIISLAEPSLTVDVIATRQEAGKKGMNIMLQYTLGGVRICNWEEDLGKLERYWLAYRTILRIDYLFKRDNKGKLLAREPAVTFQYNLDTPEVEMSTIAET
nr:type VI secretion system tube protein Hcp [Kistimonas asteriae]